MVIILPASGFFQQLTESWKGQGHTGWKGVKASCTWPWFTAVFWNVIFYYYFFTIALMQLGNNNNCSLATVLHNCAILVESLYLYNHQQC